MVIFEFVFWVGGGLWGLEKRVGGCRGKEFEDFWICKGEVVVGLVVRGGLSVLIFLVS